MRRREFIVGIAGAAAWSLAARAQQGAMPMIGFLGSGSPITSANRVNAFRQGLNEGGFVENRNVVIEYRWTDGRNDQLPAMAADLVARAATVIMAGGGAAASAAKASTTKTPIVFTTANDPVDTGLVVSLNRPGNNLTGATNLNLGLGLKRFEMLHQCLPTMTAVSLLVNPTHRTAAEIETRELQTLAEKINLRLHIYRTVGNLEADFTNFAQKQNLPLVIGSDAFLNSRSEQLAGLTNRYRIAAIHNSREFSVAGGLVSYGGNGGETYRIAGLYAARILKGEKPSDLPVQQATKVELVVNLKTAKALGLTVPPMLLARADEVIE